MTEVLSLKSLSARPVPAAVAIGSLVFLAVLLLRQLGILQAMELASYDLMLRLSQGGADQQPRVAVLGIDESDIQAIGEWPLSDGLLAGLLDRLTQLNPRVIGVDVYRDTPIEPGSDQLQTLLKSNSTLVVIEKFGAHNEVAVPPPAVLRSTDRVGFSDQPLDFDGVLRRGLLFLDDGREVHYSLALRLALQYLQAEGVRPQPGATDPSFLRLGPTTIRPFETNDGAYIGADAGGYQFMLDFHGGSNPFPVFSLDDLNNGRVTQADVEGKVVIVGVVADSVKDYFITPFRQGDLQATGMPGVILHAHSVGQLLRFALDGDRQLQVPGDHQEYFWIFLWAMAGILAALWVRTLLWFTTVMIIGVAVIAMATYAALGSGWWLPQVPAVLAWLASGALVTAYLAGHEKAQRSLVMDLFSRHVSTEVAEEIWEQRDSFSAGGRPEAKKITATVLFSDLEDFTPVSEALDPVQLMDWLNQYMEAMAGIVMAHKGFVDDYYGDAIKANFGIPVTHGRDAANAVGCALAMRAEMSRLNQRLVEQGLPGIRMRIGICTGPVVAGCLGSSRRMKYTTVGDTVNTAARLEGYGKLQQSKRDDDGYCRILIAASTVDALEGDFHTERVGSLSLKGKADDIDVYRVSDETYE